MQPRLSNSHSGKKTFEEIVRENDPSKPARQSDSNFLRFADGSIVFGVNSGYPAFPNYVLKKCKDNQVDITPLPRKDFSVTHIAQGTEANSVFCWHDDYGIRGNVTVVMMNIENKMNVGQFTIKGEIIGIHSLPNSQRFLVSLQSTDEMQIWEKEINSAGCSFKCISTYVDEEHGRTSSVPAMITADGQYCLRSVGDEVLIFKIINNTSLEVINRFKADNHWSMQLSPDDKYLLIGNQSGKLDVWDIQDKSKPFLLAQHTISDKQIYDVEFNEARNYVLIRSESNTAIVPLNRITTAKKLHGFEVCTPNGFGFIELPDFSFLQRDGSSFVFPRYLKDCNRFIKKQVLNNFKDNKDVTNVIFSCLNIANISFYGKQKQPADTKNQDLASPSKLKTL